MQLIFHKTSHERHGLLCVRDDGTQTEAPSLESKSYLRHDLMHYVIEKNAHLGNSFYGAIARGVEFGKAFSMEEIGEGSVEALTTEKVVAILQGSDKQTFEPTLVRDGIYGALESMNMPAPQYLTEEFIVNACGEFRFLLKRWDALKTGESLQLPLDNLPIIVDSQHFS